MAVSVKWDDYQPTISNAFSAFRNEKYLHDVTLLTDDQEHFTAHRLVLSVSSDYFKKMFEHTSNQQHLVICVDGVSSDVMMQLLDFIYIGEAKMPKASVQKFMAVAHRFKLNGVSLDEIDDLKSKKVSKKEQVLYKNESNIIQDDFIFEDVKKEDDDEEPKNLIQLQERTENLSENSTGDVEKTHSDSKTLKVNKKSIPRTKDGKFKSYKSDKEVCMNCNLTFDSKTEKFQHKMIHKKDYLCTFCDFKTKNTQVIREHERTHTGEKPLVCTWCGKGFSQKRSLQQHERLHTGEKPFQCKFCDSKFAQLSSLKSHTKSHHKDASKKLEQEKSETEKEKGTLDNILEDIRKLESNELSAIAQNT